MAVVLGAGFALFGARDACAQVAADAGLRIDLLQPSSPGSPFIRAEGPHVPHPGRVEFAFRVMGDYALAPMQAAIVYSDGSEHDRWDPVANAMLVHVGGAITPLHWLTADLDVPIGVWIDGEAPPPGFASRDNLQVDSAGVGDLRVGLHLRPIDAERFGLVLGGRVWAPVGSSNTFLSDKELVRFELDVAVAGALESSLYGCTLAVGPMFFTGRTGDRVGAVCAVHLVAGSFASVGVEPSFSLLSEDASGGTSYHPSFEPLGAARLHFGGFAVGVGAGPGFGDAPGTPRFRAVLSLSYAGGGEPEKPPPPPPPDTDLDGILDRDDACPKEAGPDSRDEKTRGCPAQDRDGDGVRDDDDWCPDRAGIKHEDPKANGCPDSDNDQLPDPIDPCREEPGPSPGGCPKFARLQKDGFKVDPPIVFDGRSTQLTADARSALEEIAATMRANPKLEQVSISLGTKGVRAEIADKRAQQILLVFRQGNLDSSRYEVVIRDDLKGGVVQIRLVR